MPALENAQHERFAAEYVKDYNASQAGERAGYTAQYGRMLLQNPTITTRVAELRDELTARTQITAERIARAYAELAFHDGRDLAAVLDALSRARPSGARRGARIDDGVPDATIAEAMNELPRSATAPIKEMTARVDTRGNITYSVKAHDRYRALDVLTDRYWTNDEVDDGLVTGIEAARAADAVPDMSESNDTHNTASDAPSAVAPEPDPDAAPVDPWSGGIVTTDDRPTWRDNKPRR